MFVVKARDHIISIDSNHPDRRSLIQIKGDNPEGIKEWISGLHGYQGVALSGEKDAPRDLNSGLITSKVPFEILEGEEILDIPVQKLPVGAYW